MGFIKKLKMFYKDKMMRPKKKKKKKGRYITK